jgi:F-box protein 21
MLSTQQSSSRLESEQLERALGAFDLFVLHDQPGDLDDVCASSVFLRNMRC